MIATEQPTILVEQFLDKPLSQESPGYKIFDNIDDLYQKLITELSSDIPSIPEIDSCIHRLTGLILNHYFREKERFKKGEYNWDPSSNYWKAARLILELGNHGLKKMEEKFYEFTFYTNDVEHLRMKLTEIHKKAHNIVLHTFIKKILVGKHVEPLNRSPLDDHPLLLPVVGWLASGQNYWGIKEAIDRLIDKLRYCITQENWRKDWKPAQTEGFTDDLAAAFFHCQFGDNVHAAGVVSGGLYEIVPFLAEKVWHHRKAEEQLWHTLKNPGPGLTFDLFTKKFIPSRASENPLEYAVLHDLWPLWVESRQKK